MPPADRMVLDLETASTVDLRQTGAHAYAAHPETRVTVAGYCIGLGPVQTWTEGPCPDEVADHVRAGGVVVAHNYLFELNVYGNVLHRRLGWPAIHARQWSCTMARSLAQGLPADLQTAGEALHLPVVKDKSARDLVLRMARPRTLVPLSWWHETDPPKLFRLAAYCATDVGAERGLDHALPELTPTERAVWLIDAHINQTGFRVDLDLIDRMQTLLGDERRRLNRVLTEVTEGRITSVNQISAMHAWLRERGIDTPDLRQDSVVRLLRDPVLSGTPRRVLEIRRDMARSSTAKLTAMQQARSPDGRVRGSFQYYGAGRTGRWAGRRVQPQNLPRGTIRDVPGALRMIAAGGDAADLRLFFEDSPSGVVASSLRGLIVAQPGHLLAAADFSQIEARVLCWCAGQQDMLEVFRSGADVYRFTADAIGSNSRQLGKVLVLACGFGMAAQTFMETAEGYGVFLTLPEADRAVRAFRSRNVRIVDFWWDCDRAARNVALGTNGSEERVGPVLFHCEGAHLRVVLPSGRGLLYRDVKVETHPRHGKPEMTYLGMNSYSHKWERLRTWPGKLVENIVQAIARDLLAQAMLLLCGPPDRLRIVITAHDELVAEVPWADADTVLARMLTVMRQPPPWATGLPAAAAGWVGRRYRKS